MSDKIKPIVGQWYLIRIENPSPSDDEVNTFTDYLQMTDSGWDMECYEGFNVLEIIEEEL